MKNGRYINSGLVVHVDVILEADARKYPQNIISGTVTLPGQEKSEPWIADAHPPDHASKTIEAIIRDHEEIHSNLRNDFIQVSFLANGHLILKLNSQPDHVFEFEYESQYFRTFNLEFAYVGDHSPVLISEIEEQKQGETRIRQISFEQVFDDAGIKVNITEPVKVMDVDSEAGPAGDGWSTSELNQAMNRHWSDRGLIEGAWSMWFFMVERHSSDEMYGLMFDYKGELQRQGAVLFSKEFEVYDQNIKNQLKFFYTIHEIGHALNLGHAWQPGIYAPWSQSMSLEEVIPSYMDYHDRYYDEEEGELSTEEFLEKFEFRFRNDELTFLRHAPESTVKFGASKFLYSDNNELSSTFLNVECLKLQALTHQDTYEYLEPVILELRIQNIGGEDITVDENVIKNLGNIDIEITDCLRGKHYQYEPFYRGIYVNEKRRLKPSDYIGTSFYLSSGRFGWMIQEPGEYDIHVKMSNQPFTIESSKLHVRVAKPEPGLWEGQELLVSSYFDIQTASMLSMNGSRNLHGSGMKTLETISKNFAQTKAAIHANIALAIPMTQHYQFIGKDENETEENGTPMYYDAYKRLYDVLVIRKADSLFSFGPDYYGKLEKIMLEVEHKIRGKKNRL